MVEQNPQPEAVPFNLLLLRQRVHRFWQSQKKVLRPGVLPSQPLWEGAAVMDKTQFEQIKQCGAMLAIASCLYKRGLVTNTEYRKLTAEIRKKYRPAASSQEKASSAPKEK